MLQPSLFDRLTVPPPVNLKGIVPFAFQRQMVDECHEAIANGQRDILMCAGTGAGKTFMSALLIAERLQTDPTGRSLFLVDLNALIPQTVEEFSGLGINCVEYQGSRSLSKATQARLRGAQVVVASVQTLTSHRKRKTFEAMLGQDIRLILADEAHNTAFSRIYSQLRRDYDDDPSVFFIGLSATIKTQSKGDRYLGRLFGKVIISPPMAEMIRLGRCVRFYPLSPSGVFDVSKLTIDEHTGDFDLNEQDEQLEARYPQIVRAWVKYGQNRSTTAYCPTLSSAESLAAEFRRNGISAEIQTGNTPMGSDGRLDHAEDRVTRAAQNHRLNIGATKVVCSVGTQVKGWNLPSLGAILLVRATQSLQLFLQIIGRGGRTCPDPYWNNGKPKEDCILMDFGSNLERFFPISPNDYGRRATDYDVSEIPPDEEEKPRLDFARQESEPSDSGYIEGDFDESDDDDPGDLALYEWFDSAALSQIRFLREIKQKAYQHSFHPDEAERTFLKKFGFLPQRDWHLGAVFGAFPTEQNRKDYRRYLARFSPHEFWLEQRCKEEFGIASDRPLTVSTSQPWHKILGVSPKTKKATARKAYEKLLKKYSLLSRQSPEAKAAVETLKKAWEDANRLLLR